MVTAVTLSREEAEALAQECARLLREQFGARAVTVIGSVAGDAPWHSQSDIDLVVEGLLPEQYTAAFTACHDLLPESLALDLIPLEDAWPSLRARIEGKTTMPTDPQAALEFEIENELEHLALLAAKLDDFLQNAPDDPGDIQVQGSAKYLHDFYNGVERIFERIAVRVDGDLPTGPNWHTLLLRRMAGPFAPRPPVINRALETALSDYLRFRHLFRHTYGYDLDWRRIRPLATALPSLLQQLQTQLHQFLNTLQE